MRISLRVRYLLYLGFLHAIIMLLAFKVLSANKLYFIISEVLVLLSLIISVVLYQAIHRPFKLLLMGTEAMRDQDFSIKLRPTGTPELDQLVEVYNQMIVQLRTERIQLTEQHFFLEKLIQASPIAILVLDFDGNLLKINPKAQDLFGISEGQYIHQSLSVLGHPIVNALQELQDGESKTVQINGLSTFKIQRSFFMDKGFSRPFLMIEELTSEILATEKKAYGKVIRMMAHEVNNSIGAVNSILNVAQQMVEEPHLLRALEVAYDRNERLCVFMRRFADVVRLPQPHLERQSLNEVLENMVELWRSRASEKGIELIWKAPEKEKWMIIDRGQIEQVLVNVLKNAIEACDSGNQIIVTLSEKGIQIKNNGKPIPPEQAHLLFTPFFSNKPDGQGIGLMLCREILMNHHFQFSLKTQEDGWTCFSIE